MLYKYSRFEISDVLLLGLSRNQPKLEILTYKYFDIISNPTHVRLMVNTLLPYPIELVMHRHFWSRLTKK